MKYTYENACSYMPPNAMNAPSSVSPNIVFIVVFLIIIFCDLTAKLQEGHVLFLTGKNAPRIWHTIC